MSELDEIPEGWELYKFSDIVENHDKARLPIKATERESMQGEFPYYGSTGIIDYINQFIYDGEYLLISEDGANLTVRKYPIAFIANGKFWVNNHSHVVKAKDTISTNKFIEMYFEILNFDPYITGSAQPKLSQKKLNTIPIPLPPLPEQQRIVSKLDLLFKKIDKSIELHQKNMDEANVFMGSVLNEVFGELEEKYEKKQLRDIVNNHDGKRIPIKSSDRENMSGAYPYYGASGIIDYVNDYIFDGEYLLISEDGANLTARKYPIAFIAKGKFWVNNHAHIVSAKANVSTNKYMEYAFAYTNISGYITGSAQPKMSQGKMNIIEFSIPPLPIQQKVVSYLDEISQKIEKIKQLQNEKMDSLNALKASILDSAFRGEL